MKKTGAILATFLLCFVLWLLLTGEAAGLWDGLANAEWQIIIAGAVVSLLVAVFSARFFIHESPFYILRPDRFLLMLFYCFIVFPWALIKANVDVALKALSPRIHIRPGIVKVPTELSSEYGLAMLANSITLTPGTITLDVVEEKGKHYYYIHWIKVTEETPEKAGEAIKGSMEKTLRRIWR